MSYKQLKNFIKEQALRGERPEVLRDGLLLNGWDEKDVEKALNEVYGAKKKIMSIGLILVLFLIIISAISLLIIYTETSASEKDEDSTRIAPSTQNYFDDGACENIDDLYLKEQCYIDEINEGYDCEDLKGDEFFYCSRALENYIREQYES